jgi:polygalacturonase
VKKSDDTEASSRDGIDVTLMAEFRAIDGPVNDTLTIQRAIDLAGRGQGGGVVLFKKGQTFVTWPLKLSSNIRLVIDGTLATSGDPHQYCNTPPCKALLWAEKVSNLTVTSSKKGLGEIFGNGSAWWPLRRRSYKFWAPQIFSCKGCTGVHLSNFRVRDSPAWCLENSGEDLLIEDVTILAPATSPNTDGIGIICTGGPGKPCVVRNCHIENGDDEVAVGGTNILVENSYFGLGHGASIGSLGFNGSTAHVQNVTFRNLFFNTTTSSIHIKTWQGGHGLVSNITYENIHMIKAGVPIRITQYYCPSSQHPDSCPNMTGVVRIQDVTIRNVTGTHSGIWAGKFLCSDSSGSCQNLVLENVHLAADRPAPTSSNRFLCWKAHGEATDVTPTPCLTGGASLVAPD